MSTRSSRYPQFKRHVAVRTARKASAVQHKSGFSNALDLNRSVKPDVVGFRFGRRPAREIADLFLSLEYVSDARHTERVADSLPRRESHLLQGDGDDLIWFWIGSHAEYDQLLR